jgi:ribosome maturation factor RimP
VTSLIYLNGGDFLDINICKELLIPYLNEHDLIFYSVDLVKEDGNLILRVILDKKGGIDINELGEANEYLSSKLDKYDSDMPEYFLEVSSRGAERTLDNEEEIEEAVGKYIHVKTLDMEYEGEFLENTSETITIRCNLKGRFKNFIIKKDEIKLIRLAVKI